MELNTCGGEQQRVSSAPLTKVAEAAEAERQRCVLELLAGLLSLAALLPVLLPGACATCRVLLAKHGW